jgi:hypothetical protein
MSVPFPLDPAFGSRLPAIGLGVRQGSQSLGNSPRRPPATIHAAAIATGLRESLGQSGGALWLVESDTHAAWERQGIPT